MRRFRAALLALAFGLAAAPAQASPSEVARAIPNAQKVGEARYHMLSVALFDAELYAANGAFSWTQPFALSLTYQRSARQSTLVDRTIREMSRRGAGSVQRLAPLRAQLARCFTNVARGDRMTGVSTSPDAAVIYHNGAQRCTIEWPNLRRHFFGIWLAGRDGQAARLSAQLRGEA
jgi:hypothetical protein